MHILLMLFRALGSAALVILAAPADAQYAEAGTRQAAPLVIPLDPGPYGHALIGVDLGQPVVFRGHEPQPSVPFILDTGASHTAITETVASQLGYVRIREAEVTAHSMTAPFSTERIVLDPLDFGAGPRVLEGIVLFTGETHAFSAAGLLGMDAFAGETIRIDMPGSQLLVGIEAPLRGDLILDEDSQLVLGSAQIGRRPDPVHVMIDTGATVSLINSALAHYNSRRSNIMTRLSIGGVSERLSREEPRRTVLAGLTLGNLCMPGFMITASDVHAFDIRGWSDAPAIIIGMDVLQHVEITINTRTGEVDLDAVTDFQCESGRS